MSTLKSEYLKGKRNANDVNNYHDDYNDNNNVTNNDNVNNVIVW